MFLLSRMTGRMSSSMDPARNNQVPAVVVLSLKKRMLPAMNHKSDQDVVRDREGFVPVVEHQLRVAEIEIQIVAHSSCPVPHRRQIAAARILASPTALSRRSDKPYAG